MEQITVQLAGKAEIPAIGLGTWYLGEDPSRRRQELDALRAGLLAGAALIDTAEMYGNGASERLVGALLRTVRREDVFLVSKVLPSNAGKDRIFHCCRESLKRLGTDYLDLYLLHWRGSIPLEETVFCMEQLQREGLIRAWGVSNFDTDDMQELWQVPGGDHCQVNQVLYHLGSRGIEFSLLPWMRAHRVALMAYCPLAQGGTLKRGLLQHPVLRDVADRRGVTPEQILLSWCIRDGSTFAIPRSGKSSHAELNVRAGTIRLTADELRCLDAAFPPPDRKLPLDIQ